MIKGIVSAGHKATLTFDIQGPQGQPRRITAAIDTGFSEYLSLTPKLIDELGLDVARRIPVYLGDASVRSFRTHDVTVLWDGQALEVEALASNATPQVGMKLLAGFDLSMEVVPGGRVLVKKPWRTRRRRKRPAEVGEVGAAPTGDSRRG